MRTFVETVFRRRTATLLATTCAVLFPFIAVAAGDVRILDLTGHWAGYVAVALFVLAYSLVILEENLHLRKSKPVMVAAGLIWALVAIAYGQAGRPEAAETFVRHNLLEFAELFLFLLAAMTYINAMDERGIFSSLRAWLVSQGFSYRAIYWITGTLAFFISPIADNLTTALLMVTVVMAVGRTNRPFVIASSISIVVAANAGGAFSPFGDITTLMVWQKGLLKFHEFFALFIPSVVNWLVPALLIGVSVADGKPDPMQEQPVLEHGAFVIVGLFLFTITLAVLGHNYLHLPPVVGMMTGLGCLKLFGYYLRRRSTSGASVADDDLGNVGLEIEGEARVPAPADAVKPYNIYTALERAEWDTLMFFYGIILCVGGLGAFGYLAIGSQYLYGDLGPTAANILVGLLSAVIDNIPIMFAVLSVLPEMDEGQWLLVTLTAGVGGSLLSIGSAAGVGVMGQARGIYTFGAHLKWSWAIALGYAASIWVHFQINADKFT